MRCLAAIVVILTAVAVRQVPCKTTAPPKTKHHVACVASGRAEAPGGPGNRDMDLVIMQCGINVAALTGMTWRFVFQKVDNLWILRSIQEFGRS